MSIGTYASAVSKKSVQSTPQTQPIPEKEMVKNAAGGFVFEVSKWTQLDRFLTLGSEGGTYYASEKKLTKENAQAVLACIKEDGIRTVTRIVEFSDEGRAPKNDPAIFALALCLREGDPATKAMAKAQVPAVCRIGTHLFHLAEVLNQTGGWGRGTRSALSGFYERLDEERLGEQLVKYQSRDGWSHRDILRLVHLKPENKAQKLAFKWAVGKAEPKDIANQSMPTMIQAFEAAKAAKSAKEIVKLIEEFHLPREAIPTEHLNDVKVWDALLQSGKGMPMTAMIRNLGKMTSLELLKPLSKQATFVADRLNDEELLKKARIHPLNLLIALRTYAQGHGEKGSLSWSPNPKVIAALDSAFYKSFKFVEPTGKNFLLGLDISGSMSSPASGTVLSCAEVTGAMGMLALRTEKNSHMMGFSSSFIDLGVTERDSLQDVMRKITDKNFGSTDCSLPMQYATKNGLDVDMFCVYTDNETYAGRIHPSQALKEYRKKSGRNAKLMVVALTSTNYSIADPTDAGMLDVSGFDSALPQLMAEFAKM